MSRNVTTNGLLARVSENNALARTLTAGGNGIVITNGNAVDGDPTVALDEGTQLTIDGLTVGRGGGDIASNTAVGVAALYSNTTGVNNTASGVNALRSNTTGSYNTASGYSALYYNTTGGYNTACGYGAAKNNTTGNGNVTVGAYSAAGAYAPAFDCTTEDNRVSIGTTATTNAYIQVAWTVLSDARDKTAVVDLPVGLDDVLALRPVQYQSHPRGGECDGKNRFGFIAQEVAETALGAVVVDAENPDKLRMTNEYLIPVLVKAVQQLTARVAELEKSHA